MKRLALAAALLFSTSISYAVADTADFITQGDKLWSEKKLDDAEKSYQQAIKDSPDDATAYARLAGLYMSSERTGKAITAYQEAITRNPQDARLFIGLSLAYLHQSEYSKANAMASMARSLDPNLKQADKLQEYIALKEEVIKQAEKASAAEQQKPEVPVPHSVKLHQQNTPPAK